MLIHKQAIYLVSNKERNGVLCFSSDPKDEAAFEFVQKEDLVGRRIYIHGSLTELDEQLDLYGFAEFSDIICAEMDLKLIIDHA